LNALTKQGRWDEIPKLITDEVFDALVVQGAPGDIARLIEERYAGTVDRVGLSMPYEATPSTTAAVIEGFRK
jgi:hypothetical protein